MAQAEAVIDLIDAESPSAARQAAGQLTGALSRRIEGIYSALTDTMAHFCAVLDYPDEDLDPFQTEALGRDLQAQASALQALLGDAGSKLFVMDFSFLGINLANIPKWNFWTAGFSWASIGLFLLPLVSVGISLLSMQVSLKTNQMNNQAQDETMAKTNRTMMIMMPLMSLWIGFTVPAGLSVYWIAQYIFTIFQEIICGKLLKKDYEAAQAAAAQRELEEKEEEKRRKEEARLERARRIEEEKKNRARRSPVRRRTTSRAGGRE